MDDIHTISWQEETERLQKNGKNEVRITKGGRFFCVIFMCMRMCVWFFVCILYACCLHGQVHELNTFLASNACGHATMCVWECICIRIPRALCYIKDARLPNLAYPKTNTITYIHRAAMIDAIDTLRRLPMYDRILLRDTTVRVCVCIHMSMRPWSAPMCLWNVWWSALKCHTVSSLFN